MQDLKSQTPVNYLHVLKIHYLDGYWGTMTQPTKLFTIDLTTEEIPQEKLESISTLFSQLFPGINCDHLLIGDLFNNHIIREFTKIALSTIIESNMPADCGSRCLKDNKQKKYLVGLPAIDSDITTPEQAAFFSADCINMVLNDAIDYDYLKNELERIVASNRSRGYSGTNMRRFLAAAQRQQIPWKYITGKWYQFGWGSKSRILDSSFTDKSSQIGARLARSKMSTNKILSLSGLPTPQYQLVLDESEAVTAASNIGYPVVLKPENKDGGEGVIAGIDNEIDLVNAYRSVINISQLILIEKFYPWQDYRLQVFENEVFWIAHRRPAYVIGDGTHTLQELIQQTNQIRNVNLKEQISGSEKILMEEWSNTEISIDSEVERWIKMAKLSLDSIPEKGLKVRLRGSANVSQGGTREGIELDRAHPDNIELAIKATKILRLDIAGIDLLIPDITKSYHEVGAVICEVNAQPQLSSHLPNYLFTKMFHSKGRIPIVILNDVKFSDVEQKVLLDHFKTQGINVALPNSTQTATSSLYDPTVDVIVYALAKLPNRFEKFPFDNVDILISKTNVNSHSNDDNPSQTDWPNVIDRANKCLYIDDLLNDVNYQSDFLSTLKKIIQQLLTQKLN